MVKGKAKLIFGTGDIMELDAVETEDDFII